MFKHYHRLIRLQKCGQLNLVFQCFCGVLETILSICAVWILQELIDDVTHQNLNHFLEQLPWALVTILLGIAMFFAKQTLLLEQQSAVGYALRKEMEEKQIGATFEAKRELDSGRLVSVYQTQLPLVIDFLKNLSGYLIYPLTTIIACIYFWRISPLLFVASVLLIPLSTGLYSRLSGPLQNKKRELVQKKASLTEEVKNVFQGFEVMKSFQLESYFQERYNTGIEELLEQEKQIERTNSVLGRVFILLRFIPQLIIPLFGGYLAYHGVISLGQMMAASMIISYIFNPIEQLLTIQKERKLLLPAFQEVLKVLNLSQECINDSSQETKKEDSLEVVQLQNVSFGYDDQKKIIDQVNLSISKKEHLVLIGESGSGKSTLIKLVTGMLPSFEGRIRINHQSLTKESVSEIRSQIAYIPQKIYLFHGTIFENIALKKNCSKEEVYRAARLAGAEDFITKLPDGYETIVGDGGFNLSGGQMQRIAIARGIYRDCELFLLDEPTSALDESSEKTVVQGLRELLKEKSSILITHRMNVIGKGDRVMRLKGGRLYEA